MAGKQLTEQEVLEILDIPDFPTYVKRQSDEIRVGIAKHGSASRKNCIVAIP